MEEDNSTGTNLIWAIAMIIIVAIIAGALYFTVIKGNLGGAAKKETIDININPPSSK